jgi:hypothetical protein
LGELQELVYQLGVPCRWQNKGGFQIASVDNKASNLKLNWWQQNGDFRLVGDPEARVDNLNRLAKMIENPSTED